MVLEEEIWFSSEHEAQECVKLFRSLNISAHIRTKTELESRVMYKAPFAVLKGIIEEEIARLPGTGEDRAEERIGEFSIILDHLTANRNLLAATFEKHKPGDHISTQVFDVLIRDGTMPETEESMDVFLQEATLTRILELNELLDIDGEGMILARTISPDDAVQAIFGDEIPPLQEESLKKWEIKRSLEARDDSAFVVTTGPDVVFLEDPTPLEDFFEEIEYDDETNFFFVNLQVKQVLVAEVLSMIQKDGKASKDELVTEFLHRDLQIDDEKVTIGLHLSPAYIEGILGDLKKIGILKGKDAKLKIVI